MGAARAVLRLREERELVALAATSAVSALVHATYDGNTTAAFRFSCRDGEPHLTAEIDFGREDRPRQRAGCRRAPARRADFLRP